MQEMNLGWAQYIQEKLNFYSILKDTNQIKCLTRNAWKIEVKKAIETKNTEKLKRSCYNVETDGERVKTKTTLVAKKLEETSYVRGPMKLILQFNRNETKSLILAPFGMLHFGNNFKNKFPLNCNECDVIDDENHRLNYCSKWQHLNFYNETEKIIFDDIYSDNYDIVKRILTCINKIWNTSNGNGSMKTD